MSASMVIERLDVVDQLHLGTPRLSDCRRNARLDEAFDVASLLCETPQESVFRVSNLTCRDLPQRLAAGLPFDGPGLDRCDADPRPSRAQGGSMAILYGILRGHPDRYEREDNASTPHLQIRVLEDGGSRGGLP
jgi:hypothetical protein